MDPRTHWRSPSFSGGGGRSPYPRQPRYRGGNGGGFGSPRHFSPQWQHRNPSPYRYQSQQRSPYSPQIGGPYEQHPFATSTPAHGSPRRPFFRGGGRFNKRQPFGSSMNQSSSDDIENWISPEMWSDPWRYLTTAESDRDEASTSLLVTSRSEMETGTKFAESDFDITDSVVAGSNPYSESSNRNISLVSAEDSEMDTKGQEPDERIHSEMESVLKSENSDQLLT
ncbi:unnamed protein product [Orchesella dallaii]|uniref:Uncharacterized protein n=1 Tax=Orchesella dallaii TaxID=48710 RepID=A0ABP1PXK1_9HEXA